MASVNFGKHKGAGAVKAQLRHSLTDERVKHKHNNNQIDPSRTGDNWQLYGLSYQQVCDKYDQRIAELDATTNTNKRKDRVTCFCLLVSAPEHLQDADAAKWFGRAADVIADQYGKDNLIEMAVHMDEIHEYVDARTKEQRTSRAHAHVYVVPEHDGKLHGKWFSSRANMQQCNRAIHEMSVQEFGVEFMDGSKSKSAGTVEQLKAASIKADADKYVEDVKAACDARISSLDAAQRDFEAYRTKSLDAVQKLLKSANTASDDPDLVDWCKRKAIKGKPLYDYYQADKAKQEQARQRAEQELARQQAEQQQRMEKHNQLMRRLSANGFADVYAADRQQGGRDDRSLDW